MTTLDENYLKCISDKFDLKTVFHLNLSHKNIVNIDKIRLLTNIEILDLSYNKITDMSVISSLSKAKVVDLSFNPIDSIRFEQDNYSIEYLILKGCYLNNTDQDLHKLKALKYIYLMNADYTDSNPIFGNCFNYNFNEYSRFLKRLCPSLMCIDCIRLTNRMYDCQILEDMQKFGRETAKLVYKKNDWWFKNQNDIHLFNSMNEKDRENYIHKRLNNGIYLAEDKVEETNELLVKLKNKIKDEQNKQDSQADYRRNMMEEFKHKLKTLEEKAEFKKQNQNQKENKPHNVGKYYEAKNTTQSAVVGNGSTKLETESSEKHERKDSKDHKEVLKEKDNKNYKPALNDPKFKKPVIPQSNLRTKTVSKKK